MTGLPTVSTCQTAGLPFVYVVAVVPHSADVAIVDRVERVAAISWALDERREVRSPVRTRIERSHASFWEKANAYWTGPDNLFLRLYPSCKSPICMQHPFQRSRDSTGAIYPGLRAILPTGGNSPFFSPFTVSHLGVFDDNGDGFGSLTSRHVGIWTDSGVLQVSGTVLDTDPLEALNFRYTSVASTVLSNGIYRIGSQNNGQLLLDNISNPVTHPSVVFGPTVTSTPSTGFVFPKRYFRRLPNRPEFQNCRSRTIHSCSRSTRFVGHGLPSAKEGVGFPSSILRRPATPVGFSRGPQFSRPRLHRH